jgi:hypothetical protein
LGVVALCKSFKKNIYSSHLQQDEVGEGQEQHGDGKHGNPTSFTDE